MSETAELWQAIKKDRQEKRAANRESSARELTEAGIRFRSLNGGAHLRVEDPSVDFWPGTGLWKDPATGRSGRGVFKLIRYLKGVKA